MIERATTSIHCDGCYRLEILKRKIRLAENSRRSVWMLLCKHPEFKNGVFIKTIEILNKDLHNIGMPLIISPFFCSLRQKERIKGFESKFELQIS